MEFTKRCDSYSAPSPGSSRRDPTLIIFIRAAVRPESAEQVRAVFAGLAAVCRRQEGFLLYDLHEDQAYPGWIVACEVWESLAAMQKAMRCQLSALDARFKQIEALGGQPLEVTHRLLPATERLRVPAASAT